MPDMNDKRPIVVIKIESMYCLGVLATWKAYTVTEASDKIVIKMFAR